MTKNKQTVADKIMSQPASKIHFIKNSNGKFYNSRDKLWYSEMINANYDKNIVGLKKLLEFDKFKYCEIHTTTDHELWEQMATWTTDLVLTGSYFSNILTKIACKMPTISQVDKNMYRLCNQVIDKLKPFTNWNNGFIEAKEDTTDEVSGHLYEYIHELSSIKIHEMPEITEMIKMWKVDRKSMMGVSSKVRKYKNELATEKSY